MTEHDHGPLVAFLILSIAFAGMLYFLGQELWLQDEAFSRMASTIDAMLEKIR